MMLEKKESIIYRMLRKTKDFNEFKQLYDKYRRSDEEDKLKQGLSKWAKKNDESCEACEPWKKSFYLLKKLVIACENNQPEQEITGQMLDILENNVKILNTCESMEERLFILESMVDVLQWFIKEDDIGKKRKIIFPAILYEMLGDIKGKSRELYGKEAFVRVYRRCGENLVHMGINMGELHKIHDEDGKVQEFLEHMCHTMKEYGSQYNARKKEIKKKKRKEQARRIKIIKATLALFILLISGGLCFLLGKSAGRAEAEKEFQQIIQEIEENDYRIQDTGINRF